MYVHTKVDKHPVTGVPINDTQRANARIMIYVLALQPFVGACLKSKVPKSYQPSTSSKGSKNGKNYTLYRRNSKGNATYKKAGVPEKIKQPIENGPYIKNGKPNGRPQLSGEKKLQFEKDVYNNQVDPDGILRDPNTGEVIDWKPGSPRKKSRFWLYRRKFLQKYV